MKAEEILKKRKPWATVSSGSETFNVYSENTVIGMMKEYAESFGKPPVEPKMIQSAFIINENVRILVCTSDEEIKSFNCDKNWNCYPTPFAQCPLTWSKKSATEYHLHLRNEIHKPENLVKERSTEIDWV